MAKEIPRDAYTLPFAGNDGGVINYTKDCSNCPFRKEVFSPGADGYMLNICAWGPYWKVLLELGRKRHCNKLSRPRPTNHSETRFLDPQTQFIQPKILTKDLNEGLFIEILRLSEKILKARPFIYPGFFENFIHDPIGQKLGVLEYVFDESVLPNLKLQLIHNTSLAGDNFFVIDLSYDRTLARYEALANIFLFNVSVLMAEKEILLTETSTANPSLITLSANNQPTISLDSTRSTRLKKDISPLPRRSAPLTKPSPSSTKFEAISGVTSGLGQLCEDVATHIWANTRRVSPEVISQIRLLRDSLVTQVLEQGENKPSLAHRFQSLLVHALPSPPHNHPSNSHLYELMQLLDHHLPLFRLPSPDLMPRYLEIPFIGGEKSQHAIYVAHAALVLARIICDPPPPALAGRFHPDVRVNSHIPLDGLVCDEPDKLSLSGSLLDSCQADNLPFAIVEIKTPFRPSHSCNPHPDRPRKDHLDQLYAQLALMIHWWNKKHSEPFKLPFELILVYLRGLFDHKTWAYPVTPQMIEEWYRFLERKYSHPSPDIAGLVEYLKSQAL